MDVLIAGAGPVGLTMAAELARYGLTVRIIDKAAARTDKSKALVVWSRTLELLARAGCAESLVAAGHQVTAANFLSAGRTVARVPLSTIASRFPYALVLPQSDTERLLEQHLQSLGVTVERGVELTAFADTGAEVAATLRHPDGREETCKAAWLAGCDGAHSIVRHALGMAFPGSTMQTDWILADLHLTGMPVPATELGMFLHEDGVLATFPIAPGRYRVIADAGRSVGGHPADPTLPMVQAVIDTRGPAGVVASRPIWLSSFRINERKVKTYRDGRVFLAGDAAHVHSPAGGQGMNTGMQDAFNLAWKLAMVQQGNASDAALLPSYSIERGAVADAVLADAGRLTALATLRGGVAQGLRNFAAAVLLRLPPARRLLASRLAELATHYPRSPLNGPARGVKGPAPGTRLPPAASPPVVNRRPLFAILADPSNAVTLLLQSFSELLEPNAAPPPGKGIWLVRPDGYVAAVAPPEDTGAIAAYLNALRRG